MRHALRTDATGTNKYDPILSAMMFLYCLSLPFEEAIASSFGSILRFFGILIILYCYFNYLGEPVEKKNLKLMAPFIVWVFFSALSLIWSNDYTWWSYFFTIYLFQVMFVTVVISYGKFLHFDALKLGLIAGAVVASAILMGMPTSSVLNEEGRRTIILFEKELDPNIVASIILLGIFMVIEKFFNGKRNPVTILILLFLVVGMLFTGSRGALIAFVLGFGVQLLCQMKKNRTRKRAFFMLLFCLIEVIVALSVLPQELILSRFSKETLFGINEYQNGVHNRYTIWKYALSLVGGSPIIGYGCGNFFPAIATVYRECASHNLYILLLVENGVVGLIIFGYGLIQLLVMTYKKELYSAFGMLLSVCIIALSLDSVAYKYFWVCMIVTVISVIKAGVVEKEEPS